MQKNWKDAEGSVPGHHFSLEILWRIVPSTAWHNGHARLPEHMLTVSHDHHVASQVISGLSDGAMKTCYCLVAQ